jgi:hypothetical protein
MEFFTGCCVGFTIGSASTFVITTMLCYCYRNGFKEYEKKPNIRHAPRVKTKYRSVEDLLNERN